MSLINDALKRASEVKPTSTLDPNAAPLRPAEPNTKKSTWTWVWYAVALMTAAVLASWAMIAGYLASRELRLASSRNVVAREVSQTSAQPSTESIVETARRVQATQPEVAGKTNPVVQSAVPAVVSTNVLALNELSPPATNSASLAQVPDPPKPVVPTFKLQAIFYRPANPQALINSKTVRRGDKVLDAKVMLIERDSVTLQRAGEKVVLTLPE